MFLCKSLRGHGLLKETKTAEWVWRYGGRHCGMMAMNIWIITLSLSWTSDFTSVNLISSSAK